MVDCFQFYLINVHKENELENLNLIRFSNITRHDTGFSLLQSLV